MPKKILSACCSFYIGNVIIGHTDQRMILLLYIEKRKERAGCDKYRHYTKYLLPGTSILSSSVFILWTLLH